MDSRSVTKLLRAILSNMYEPLEQESLELLNRIKAKGGSEENRDERSLLEAVSEENDLIDTMIDQNEEQISAEQSPTPQS